MGGFRRNILYRASKLLPIFEDGSDASDQELVEIKRLVKHDQEFCQRLKNDKEFHDVFWYWKRRGSRWSPHSDYQKEATSIIEESIRKRVELVCRQKLLLGESSLSPEKLKSLQELANSELGYVVQWTNEDKPGHRDLRLQIEKAFDIDYLTSIGRSD